MASGWRQGLAAVALALAALAGLELAARLLEPRDRRSAALAFRAPPPKAAGALRIFVFGSSVAWGAPVPELGFAAQLEYWLARSRPDLRVELYNYSVPGRDSERILDALRGAIGWQPDLLLIEPGFGAFMRDRPLSEARKWLLRLQRRSALLRLGRRSAFEARGGDARRATTRRGPYFPEDAEYRERLASYFADIDDMLDVATSARVPLLLLTATSNLADWPPGNRNIAERVYAQDPGFPAQLDALESTLRQGRLDDATARLAEARARRPEDAALDYWQGKLEQTRGHAARARELFVCARDRDPLPWRITSEANDFLRRAAQRDGVALVDAEAALAAAALDDLVGLEWIVDNAHLSARGGDVVAAAILQRMAEGGRWLPADAEALRLPAAERLRQFLGAARAKSSRDLDSQVLAESALYCMKFPFQKYAIARRYLEQLAAREAPDWEIWGNLASAAFFLGDLETGLRELQRAAESGPDEDLLHSRAVPYLAEALERAGLRCAFEAPQALSCAPSAGAAATAPRSARRRRGPARPSAGSPRRARTRASRRSRSPRSSR